MYEQYCITIYYPILTSKAPLLQMDFHCLVRACVCVCAMLDVPSIGGHEVIYLQECRTNDR